MLSRRSIVVFIVATAVCTMGGAASADVRTSSDDNDTPGFLDVRTATHRHGERARILIHEIETFRRWRSRRLRCGEVEIHLGPSDRWVSVSYEAGAFRTRLYDISGDDRIIARPKVWRPDRRSVAVRVRRRWLGTSADRYRWSVSTIVSPSCREDGEFSEVVYLDEVPDEGRFVHRL